MSVKYRVIQCGQPGVEGGGTKLFYPSPVMDGEMDIEGLTEMIGKISTVSCADIRGVIYSMVDVAVQQLANIPDKIEIRLGDLGGLRMSLSSECGEMSQEKFMHKLFH